jgi:hypothetical protein
MSSPAASTPITPVFNMLAHSGRSASVQTLPPAVQAVPASWAMPSQAIASRTEWSGEQRSV